MVVMGRIVAPYGIQGWLKVQPETETLYSLLDYPDWWLGRDDESAKSGSTKNIWQKYEVENAKMHVNILLVKLRGIDDRDAALAVKSKRIAVPREQLPEAGKDEYYWSDLIGLNVTNQQQVDFGVIRDVFETGANDVIVVKNDLTGQERLLPFIDDVILEVDMSAGTVQVDWDAEF
jgi:16S rRNA processing protein RimM